MYCGYKDYHGIFSRLSNLLKGIHLLSQLYKYNVPLLEVHLVYLSVHKIMDIRVSNDTVHMALSILHFP
jgi:hypothetical protein